MLRLNKKAIQHRLTLFAGSSLAAASLAVAGLALAPATALADNECGEIPAADGDAPDDIVCPAGTYPDGITHESDGDLEISFDLTGSDYGTGGTVTTAGDADDNLSLFVTGAGNQNTLNNPFPVLFDVESIEGDISLTFDPAVDDFDIGATHAATSHIARLISSGGDITVIGAAPGTEQSLFARLVGVEARTGGDGEITIRDLAASGADYGIIAETTTGDITINANGSASGAAAVAGIHATTDSGLITINGVGSGGAGSGILVDTGADVVINGAASGNGTAAWAADILLAPGGTATINGSVTSGGSSTASGMSLRVQGGEAVVNASGGRGRVDFSGLDGAATFTLQGGASWLFGGASVFSGQADQVSILDGGRAYLGYQQSADTSIDLAGGADTFTVAEGGVLIAARQDGGGVERVPVLDFGAGADTFTNLGVILVGPKSVGNPSNPELSSKVFNEAELRFENLETFDNGGLVLLGGYLNEEVDQGTDLWFDDILSIPGATFTGMDGSQIVFDVDLNAGAQAACDPALRNADGDLAADCVYIGGGETAGETLVTIKDIYNGDRGAYNPEGVVLIDVAGGTSAAEHFVLDPGSDNYSSAFGGVIDKGLVVYKFAYDPDTSQHKLVGLAGAPALEQPLLAHAANAAWRTSTAGYFNRQADLRDTLQDADGGGVWARAAFSSAERDLVRTVEAAGNTFAFDIGGEQTAAAANAGMDLIAERGDGGAVVLGVMVGYLTSEVEFDASGDSAQFDGVTAGLYGSLVMGGFFVDAVASGAKLDMKNDAPSLGLFPAGTLVRTDLLSLGGEVEAGWRWRAADMITVEPLAGLSYVTTSFDDIYVPADDPARQGNTITFEDATSLRGSLGARLSVETGSADVGLRLSLSGKLVNEFDGEAAAEVANAGPTARLADELSGTFTEIGAGVAIYSLNGRVSGFANGVAEFADDYQGSRFTAGVRLQW